jgi:hypothetical protein
LGNKNGNGWDVNPIRLSQDMKKLLALVNAVMNLWIPNNAENFLPS